MAPDSRVWAARRFAGQFRWWQIYAISNLAGNLSFIFGLILWATSLQIIRRNYFEVKLVALGPALSSATQLSVALVSKMRCIC